MKRLSQRIEEKLIICHQPVDEKLIICHQPVNEKLIINKNFRSAIGGYEAPSGDVKKLDRMILHEYSEMGKDAYNHYDTIDDSEFHKLRRMLENKLGGYDISHNRIDDMEKLINYVVKDLFDEKYIIHVFKENEISDKIADELGDDNFFELLPPTSGSNYRSSFKYYIGEETVYIQYRRVRKPLPSDFDIFIFKF